MGKKRENYRYMKRLDGKQKATENDKKTLYKDNK